MPRPTTKATLLEAAASGYGRFTEALAAFPADRREDVSWAAPVDDQSRNPRDVVTHLHAWHLMSSDWCRVGDGGGFPLVPAPGRTWRETPVINAEIWARYAATPYREATLLLAGSHSAMLDLIAAHTDEQLFSRGAYSWTRSTTLGAYFISATSSHYLWGVKTLKAIRRHA